MRYRDRKGNEYNGENGQDRLLAFVYGHAVTGAKWLIDELSID